MKILVDELPHYRDECIFAESRRNAFVETWVTCCKLTNEICELELKSLELNERVCRFLKKQDA